MYLLWRLLYWLLDTCVVLRLASAIVRTTGWLRGGESAEYLLTAFWTRCVLAGGTVNPHLSRFGTRLRRQLRNAGRTPNRRAVDHGERPLRVGFIGRFSGAFSFPKPLFEGFPRSADLFVFDVQYKGRWAPYLAACAAGYVPIDLDGVKYEEGLGRAARAINDAEVDLLLNIVDKQDGCDLIGLLDAPCIAHYCTGPDLLHHERVDIQLCGLAQADYVFKDGRIFCTKSRSWLPSGLVWPMMPFYDLRQIDRRSRLDWVKREPLITFHGSLYKLAQLDFLRTVFDLMNDDRSLGLVFMGKDDGSALSLIRRVAGERGLSSRVHYEGEFSGLFDSDGCVSDDGWTRMRSFLSRARLAPDPWPVVGGSSRCEAYASGVPSVSLRFDRPVRGRCRLLKIEVPALHVPHGTARSVEEYRDICRRCLYEDTYAAELMEQQLDVVRQATDATRWWADVLAAYHQWRRDGGTSRRTAALLSGRAASSDEVGGARVGRRVAG